MAASRCSGVVLILAAMVCYFAICRVAVVESYRAHGASDWPVDNSYTTKEPRWRSRSYRSEQPNHGNHHRTPWWSDLTKKPPMFLTSRPTWDARGRLTSKEPRWRSPSYRSEQPNYRNHHSTPWWFSPSKTPRMYSSPPHRWYTEPPQSSNHICYKVKIMYFNTTVLTRHPCQKKGFSKRENMTYNIPPHDGSMDNERSKMPFLWCYKTKILKVTVFVKNRICCKGWTLGTNGCCDVRVNSVCKAGCINGATCDSWRRRCVCSRNFTGSSCEIPVCHRPCLNGGRCTFDQTCECPHSFTGRRCQIPKCTLVCLNGGSCVMIGFRSICLCPDNYYFPKCERVWKGRRSGGCYHNGRYYKTGQTYSVKPCEICKCIKPDDQYSGAVCATMRCPDCDGYNTYKLRNKCCPVCINKRPKPYGYKAPRFDNCPSGIIVLHLDHGRRSAKLTHMVSARDHRGRRLDVAHSATVFKYVASNRPKANLRYVIAVARDAWQVQTCHFVVRIKDQIPPHFTYCPDDQFTNHNSTPKYPQPVADDNVGLQGEPECDMEWEKSKESGRQLVTCAAMDFEGNLAYCQFAVNKYKTAEDRAQAESMLYPNKRRHHRGHHHHDHHDHGHHDHGHHHHHCHHYAIIGGCVAALVVIVVIVACVCHRRHRRRRRETEESPAKSNVVYAVPTEVSGKDPPAYECVVVTTKMAVSDSGCYDNEVKKD